MAHSVEYTGEAAYFPSGAFWRPMLPIRIRNPLSGDAIDVQALVDSGADYSAIPLAGLQVLGVDLRTLRVDRTLGTAGVVQSYETSLIYELCGITCTASVRVPDSPDFQHYLIGREPFFRLIHFGFEEYSDVNRNKVLWRIP